MNYLLIENKGEIDIHSLILMGGSTKRDSKEAIGFFGSGNKYAIALLVKNNVDFRIFSGEKEVVITTKPVCFRDKEFDQIIIDGQETSLTTDMGPKWEMWMTVREFVSNAIDEKVYNIVTTTNNIEAKNGYTRIYIPHIPEIKEVVDNWDKYFSFDRTDVVLEVYGNAIYPQINIDESTLYYRKGIRCHASLIKSLFHYDLENFEINESRVVEKTWEAEGKIIKFLADYGSVKVAHVILSESCKKYYAEREFYWDNWASKLNYNWKEAIGERVIIVEELAGWYTNEQCRYAHFIVNKSLAKIIKLSFPDVKVYGLLDASEKSAFRKTSTTPKIEYILKKAVDFFNETGYLINYPIEVGLFSENTQLGGIGTAAIHISEQAFDRGLKMVVSILIEENEHLKTKYKDCSRDFQNHWINLYVTEMEQRSGVFL